MDRRRNGARLIRRFALGAGLTVAAAASGAGPAHATVTYEDHFAVSGKIAMSSSYWNSSQQTTCGYLTRRLEGRGAASTAATFDGDLATIGLMRGQTKSIFNPTGKGYWVALTHASLRPAGGSMSRRYTYKLTETGHKDNPDCFVNPKKPDTSGCGVRRLGRDASVESVSMSALVVVPFAARDPFGGCPNESGGNFAGFAVPEAVLKKLADPNADSIQVRGKAVRRQRPSFLYPDRQQGRAVITTRWNLIFRRV